MPFTNQTRSEVRSQVEGVSFKSYKYHVVCNPIYENICIKSSHLTYE